MPPRIRNSGNLLGCFSATGGGIGVLGIGAQPDCESDAGGTAPGTGDVGELGGWSIMAAG